MQIRKASTSVKSLDKSSVEKSRGNSAGPSGPRIDTAAEEANQVAYKDIARNTRNFFSSRMRKNNNLQGLSHVDVSLNAAVRKTEYNRIVSDNEAMLKRL
jgi:hypothetical protein